MTTQHNNPTAKTEARERVNAFLAHRDQWQTNGHNQITTYGPPLLASDLRELLTTDDHAPAHGIPRPTLPTQPTTLEIVRNIENGNRAQAAAQITEHPEPARMAIAVLSTLAEDPGWGNDAKAWRDAAVTVVRTLNAGDPGSWADVARCGHRDCRTTCRNDHASNQ